jgi:hypothetical protein
MEEDELVQRMDLYARFILRIDDLPMATVAVLRELLDTGTAILTIDKSLEMHRYTDAFGTPFKCQGTTERVTCVWLRTMGRI